MTIRVYNTMSGVKEDFQPLEPGKVGMYVCGVTVYDYCHIGHARGALVFDVIHRYLEYRGYEVTFVRNFTDVDDKIIQRAGERGCACGELSEEFIKHYYDDMDRLGLGRADEEPRATEHMAEIIEMVRGLLEKGYAYEVSGDVYFRVDSFKGYGALSHRTLEDMRAGARIEVDQRKENPLDFALWKSSKPGEPSWDSPWGKGRPGWHIECSAMSMKYLGKTFDIHGGGKDLIFPHHENEIAQSEAFSGQKFVRYWLHNGFVSIDREKMSKSLGNFFTIREVLDKYDAEVVRLFLLSTHYRSPIDFSDQNLTDKKTSLIRFYWFLGDVEKRIQAAKQARAPTGNMRADWLLNDLKKFEDAFVDAMDDDFNTAKAIGEVFRMTDSFRQLVSDPADLGPSEVKYLLDRYLELLGKGGKVSEVLGVFNSSLDEWHERLEEKVRPKLDPDREQEIRELIAQREQCRADRNWKDADRIRDDLLSRGITLKDGPEGTEWQLAE